MTFQEYIPSVEPLIKAKVNKDQSFQGKKIHTECSCLAPIAGIELMFLTTKQLKPITLI